MARGHLLALPLSCHEAGPGEKQLTKSIATVQKEKKRKKCRRYANGVVIRDIRVTMIGHARTGVGYRNEFQTENYGLLTNQDIFLLWVYSFSHVEHMSMFVTPCQWGGKFAHILT